MNDYEEEKNENYILDENSQIEDFDIEKADEEYVKISRRNLAVIKNLINEVKEKTNKICDLLGSYALDEDLTRIEIGQLSDDKFSRDEESESGQVIEGVFDGEGMVGPDGKQYSVPSNYASKSKLVEGDIMKLTIMSNGTFVYKQIGPAERQRIVGYLDKNSEGNYLVESEGKKWRVLNASVTYFKGGIGDEVILLVPKLGDSKWGAVENIIKKSE